MISEVPRSWGQDPNGTGMPFAPAHYTVKRNYSRVFQCAFLAAFIDNRLIVTDVCRELIKGSGISSVDDYLFNYINRFRFPFPAFDNYNDTEQRVYPFCAIIKLLMAKKALGEEAKLSVDDIFYYLIANNVSGLEPVEYYTRLTPQPYAIQETERRQLREMIIFISQLSILKVNRGCIYLDVVSENAEKEIVEKFLSPVNRPPRSNRTDEFFEMTQISGKIAVPTFELFTADINDMEFIEGKRKRVEHFKVERSPLLRKYYMEQNPQPRCSACNTDMALRYPWTEYMLDIHHLLPLSSTVAITMKGTSLSDIVGLCPSCHRAIHIYYKKWLKNKNQDDFTSRIEAHNVFLAAVKEIA